MITADSPSTELNPIEVVDCEDCRSLVFVGQPRETLELPCFLVASHTAVHYFAELTGNSDEISLIHAEVEPAEVYIGRVNVIIVPRGRQWCQLLQLFLSDALDVLYLIHF